MNYWLVSAEDRSKKLPIKIQNQSIVYRDRCRFETAMRMNAEGFAIEPAKVALGGNVRKFMDEKAHHRWKSMIKKGITTALLLLPVQKKQDVTQGEAEVQKQLSSPIDYILVPSIPSRKLSPAFIQFIILKKYPVIEISFSSLEECKQVPWDWIRQAVGPSTISFIFRFPAPAVNKERLKKMEWEKQLSALFPVISFQNGPILNKNEMQMAGLYPKKGSLVRGDADYLLYYKSEYTNHDEQGQAFRDRYPDIVVMRGNVLKAGPEFHHPQELGYYCDQILPGRLRSINYAEQ
ncbi:hypothetical protein [Salibacterium aidingense]|uniref:hypothetical protein n=1 Tax=Salibacterium aidingense TaxID=384933 RepID=UPI003BE66604